MKQAERSGQHRWTRHEYVRLIDHGLLDEDDPSSCSMGCCW